jgi:hypothetical protein
VPSVLRKIRKSRWYTEEKALKDYPWLLQGELPADPLGDLATNGNSLSVWIIEDDRSNLGRVIAALACTTKSLDDFDYGLVDLQVILSAGLKLNQTTGDTADYTANISWHSDLIELSAIRLLDFAKAFWIYKSPGRMSHKDIMDLIFIGVKEAYLDREKIKIESQKLLDKLDTLK